MALGLIGGIGLVVCALVIWLTTRAAAIGQLRLNAFAGIRTRATMSSDAAWVAGHRAALPAAQVTAAMCTVVAVALVVAGLAAGPDGGADGGSGGDQAVLWTLFVIGYAVLAVGIAVMLRASTRAAREAA